MKIDTEYLNVTDAAKQAGMCPTTFLKHAALGGLPMIVLPSGRRRVSREVLRNWMQSFSKPATMGGAA